MDYLTTYELYKRIGQAKRFENSPDFHQYNKMQRWLEKVKSKRTGDFYQADELIRRELVPNDWKAPHVDANDQPKTYPLKQTTAIIRVRANDGGEWILSRQEYVGLDLAGNPVNISVVDPEMFDDILPIYSVKPEKPGDRDTKYIREVVNIEHRTKYTEPFNPETVQRLYDMKNGKCSLILKDETADIPPRDVISLSDFTNRPFDELLDYLTPKASSNQQNRNTETQKQYG
jgi:hypothetical protein